MKASLLLTLYKLAELGAYPDEVVLTTVELAKTLGLSQQTASRHLIELERMKLVRRVKVTRRETIQITQLGASQLNRMFLTLKGIFEEKRWEIVVEGEVFSGLGEGAYYMSQQGYRQQFIRKLGFDPFPGTLNVRVSKEYARERRILETCPFILIEGFSDGTRSFGPVRCYRARINDDVDGAILNAVRTHYGGDVVELISAHNLRETFKLRDGDSVRARAIITAPRQASA